MEWLFRLIEAPLIWLSAVLSEKRTKRSPLLQSAQSIGYSLADATYGDLVDLPSSSLARHVYALGATGSGKTNFILKLLERDIRRRHAVAVIDLRGDLVERALALCLKMNVPSEHVVLLDLREQRHIVGFNPLAGAAEPFVRALHLLDTIRAESDSWGVQLEETLRNALLLLAHGGGHVTDLESVLFNGDYLESLLAECEEPGVISFFERYQGLSEERQLSFALPVLNKVTPLLATPGVRAVLGSPKSIDLEAVLARRGTVLLVALAVDELHRTSRMIGALIVSAISRVMCARVRVPESQRNPVRLYVDEFEAMACESFEALIAEGRRFKLSLVLSHQNLAQLPQKLRSVIRNNVGLQALFRCGFGDAKELASELPDGFTVDDLTSFQPGEVLLMERGSDTGHIQCELMETAIGTIELREYRASILQRIGTPIEELNRTRTSSHSSTSFASLHEPWTAEGGPWN